MTTPGEQAEARLVEEMALCHHDPYRFVMIAFPWGQGELSNHSGPDQWQRDTLDEVKTKIERGADVSEVIALAVASGHGVGKAHHYELHLDTPSGVRRWGDLTEGDTLFGADGAPTKIIKTHHFQNVPMYRVTFDDGSFSDVSSGHLWNVRGRQERRKGLKTWRTLETEQIVELGVKRSNGASLARQWEIPIQGAAQFESREVDLHPYFVGLWLGDGTMGQPAYTKPNPEIAAKVASFGYDIVERGGNVPGHYYVRGIKHLLTDDVFSKESHERYIPRDYKFNTIENRMALFCGLCDSDGEANDSGSIGFASTSLQLAEDMLWLARSLGCKAMMQDAVKHGWYPDGSGGRVECKDCYRLTINAPFNPFTHAARRAVYKPSEARYTTRWIDSIEPIAAAGGMCVTVSAPDGLYLANDFIVTHNSTLVSWLILWAISTMPDTRGVITANTETQLRTKTWAELAKWHRLCICRHWFNMSATALYSADPEHERTWRIDKIAWSEENTEAFAGLHNQGRRILVAFDEASSIPDIIWETTEGALTDTDTEIIWAVFGNPTRNTGRFKECFGRFKHRWITKQVDSRTAKLTNKRQIAEWVADYGEDSDFVRIRVRGEFPRVGSMQFISTEAVDIAMRRPDDDVAVTLMDPLVMGVDVARFGTNASVIKVRRGRDARTHKAIKLRGVDTMTLATRVADEADRMKVDAIFVDEGGVGGGVVDRLRQLRVPNVFGVHFGGKPDRSTVQDSGFIIYANKRAEIYGLLRDWLKGGLLEDDKDLAQQLTGIEYGYVMREGKDAILLEKKEDMERRGLPSPDDGDALALTFAHPISPTRHAPPWAASRPTHQIEHNPMSSAWNGQPGAQPQQQRQTAWMPHVPNMPGR